MKKGGKSELKILLNGASFYKFTQGSSKSFPVFLISFFPFLSMENPMNWLASGRIFKDGINRFTGMKVNYKG